MISYVYTGKEFYSALPLETREMTSVIMRNLRLLITCAFILPLSNLYAQSYTHVRGFEPAWVWLDPMPTGEQHALFVRTMNGFMVYDHTPTGSGIYSSDKGQTWSEFEVKDSEDSLLFVNTETIQFLSDTLGYTLVVRDSSYATGSVRMYSVVRSIDGGFHWMKVGALPSNFRNVIWFKMLTPQFGWFETAYHNRANGGYIQSLFISNDSCRSWKLVKRDSLFQPINFVSDFVSFSDSLHGWLYRYTDGHGSWISRTTNAGLSWDTLYSAYGASDTVGFLDLCFIDSLHGWSVHGGAGHYTTNGGQTWQWFGKNDPRFADSMFTFNRVSSSGRCTFISYPQRYNFPSKFNNFMIFASTTNNGLTWRSDSTPLGTYLPDLLWGGFVDDTTAAFLGEGGLFKMTTNSGRTWTQNVSGCPWWGTQLQDVFFLNHHTGFISLFDPPTQSGTWHTYSTHDGGRNWKLRTDLPSRQTAPAWKNHATYENKYVWFADMDSISISSDTGSTFKSYSLPAIPISDDAIETLAFADSVNGWFGTYYGFVYHTTNGGVTWRKQLDGFNCGNDCWRRYTVKQIFPINEHDVVAMNGYFIHTTNGGLKWDTVDIKDLYDDLFDFGQIVFASPTHGFLSYADEIPNLKNIETLDGGRTWHKIDHILRWSLQFLDSLHGASPSARTSDGGFTWTEFIDISKTGFSGGQTTSFWIDSSEAWEVFAGGNPSLVHYGFFHDDTDQVGIAEMGTGISLVHSPSLTSFPNPFSEKTVIDLTQFEVQASARIQSLIVCDALGIIVADLTEQAQQNHRVVFDGALFPSGLYFCRSVVGNQTFVRTLAVTH